MDYDLQKTARRLGTTRPKLIELMREKGLLNARNLPANPQRDKLYLTTKDGQWFHHKLGMQYSKSTRVKPAGIAWLAEKLGIERPSPPADDDRRYVA